jgi:hypothetical protein
VIAPTASDQNFVGDAIIQHGTLVIDPALKDKSLEDILDSAGLNFPVYKVQTQYVSPISGKTIRSSAYSVINGLNDVELGKGFSADYVALSYPDILNAVFQDIKNLDGFPTRAINFRGGARAAIQFNFPNDVYNIGDQEHKTFYNVYAGHDGTIGILVNGSDIRIICGNTFRMSMSDKTLKLGFKHTENVQSRLAELQELFTFAKSNAAPYYALQTKALKTPARSELINSFMELMIPNKEVSDSTRKANEGPANRRIELENAMGETASERNSSDLTVYDVFQGALRYSNYRTQKRDSAEQFEYVNAQSGQGQKFNAKAYAWEKETLE